MSHANSPKLGNICASDYSFRGGSTEPLYAPLDSSIESIRLVRILPSSSSQLVDCVIVTTTTADSYSCLSYCWGEPSEQLIRLNGCFVAVRENLHDFLQEARRRGISQLLWIDALCIDQSNVAERNHQVKQMAAIYRSARQVIVWLGIDIAYVHGYGDNTSEHDAFVKNLASEQALTTPPLTVVDLQSRWPRGTLFHNDGRLFIYNLHLFYLCQNPYWSRIWILQEFLLARTLTIWWGRDHFPAEGLLYTVSRNYIDCEKVLEECKLDAATEMRFRDLLYLPVPTDQYIVEESLQVLEQVHRFTKFRQVLHSETALPSLCDTIQKLKPPLCTDNRDRVYALLSLASDAAGFDVDYEEDLIHLYLRLLQHNKALNPLQFQDRTTQAISLARCLGVDAEGLCRSIFECPEALQQQWNATFQPQIDDQGIKCEVWALHSPLSYPTRGSVAQAAHTLRSMFTRRSRICSNCLGFANSFDVDEAGIVEFGAPEVWLQMNTASYSPNGRPMIRALQHHNGTFFEADRSPGRIRLAFEENTTSAGARWLLVVKKGELTLGLVLPNCVSRNCALSERAWQRSRDKTLQPVTKWAVTPTPNSSGPKFDREVERTTPSYQDPLAQVMWGVFWIVIIVVIWPPYIIYWVSKECASFAVKWIRRRIPHKRIKVESISWPLGRPS